MSCESVGGGLLQPERGSSRPRKYDRQEHDQEERPDQSKPIRTYCEEYKRFLNF